MIADSSHVAAAASTAMTGTRVATVWTWVAVAATLLCLLRSYRLPGGGEPDTGGIDRWGVIAFVCQCVFSYLPTHRLPHDPTWPSRAVVSVLGATLGLALAAWEVAARLRYRDRSPRVASPQRFLTYGPYAHVRRPRDLIAVLLIVAVNALTLPWLALIPLAGVMAWAFAHRARWYDDAAAHAFGEPYELYCEAVPLLVPRRQARERPGA